jgi:hypothetical protein
MRYIIRTRTEPAALAAFLNSIKDDPAIAVVDSIGPTGQVHTVVVDVTADKAPLLERALGESTQLMIERDRPLSLDQ